MTSCGCCETNSPPHSHNCETPIDDYCNSEDMEITSRRERVIEGRGAPRIKDVNATPAKRIDLHLDGKVELEAANEEEKEKDNDGSSSQHALKTSIEGKWGHDMYDKICEKTVKHTLAEHWGNSYGFRNQRDGSQQRLGLGQKNSEVLSSDWRQGVRNSGRNHEGDARRVHKPGVCFDYLKGQCYRGGRCKFSHDDNRGVRTAVCYYWQKGLCKRGVKCIYSHEVDQGVYGVRDVRRSNMCFDFLKGVCYRESCKFSHEGGVNGACSQKEEVVQNDSWIGSSERGSSCQYSNEEYSRKGNSPSEGQGRAPKAGCSAGEPSETCNPGDGKKRDDSWENTSWESLTSSSENKGVYTAEANGATCDPGYESKGNDSREETSWEASTSSLLKKNEGRSESFSGETELTIPFSDQGTNPKDHPDEAQEPSKPEQTKELFLGNVHGKIENLELLSMNKAKVPTFNLILVGDASTGKTTFIKRHKTGEFEKKYNATSESEVHRLTFFTNLGKVVFNCWDAPGQLQFDVCDQRYVDGNACIIMFDVSSRESFFSVPVWYKDLTSVYENIPIALCGNKVDLKDRKVKQKDILLHRKKLNMQYYDISVKTNYNFEKPLLWIARQLCGDMNLVFKEEPVLPPSGFHISEKQMLHLQKQLADANKINLPDDEDFDE